MCIRDSLLCNPPPRLNYGKGGLVPSTERLCCDAQACRCVVWHDDREANRHYADVWAKDIQNPCSEPFGAESADSVQQRTARNTCRMCCGFRVLCAQPLVTTCRARLVARLDEQISGEGALVVLISHGDALQILQTVIFIVLV
eukprot:4578790-Amphidinium_carterae.1